MFLAQSCFSFKERQKHKGALCLVRVSDRRLCPFLCAASRHCRRPAPAAANQLVPRLSAAAAGADAPNACAIAHRSTTAHDAHRCRSARAFPNIAAKGAAALPWFFFVPPTSGRKARRKTKGLVTRVLLSDQVTRMPPYPNLFFTNPTTYIKA